MKDYFGKEINVGDKVIRALHSAFEEREVVKITDKGIYFKRLRRYWDWYKASNYDVKVDVSEVSEKCLNDPDYSIEGKEFTHRLGQWYKSTLNTPLYVRVWDNKQFIKLNK